MTDKNSLNSRDMLLLHHLPTFVFVICANFSLSKETINIEIQNIFILLLSWKLLSKITQEDLSAQVEIYKIKNI